MQQKWYYTDRSNWVKPVPRTNKYNLTEQAIQVWKFVAAYFDEHGYPPHMNDVREGCDLTDIVLRHAVEDLEKKGLVWHRDGYPRSLQLLTRPE